MDSTGGTGFNTPMDALEQSTRLAKLRQQLLRDVQECYDQYLQPVPLIQVNRRFTCLTRRFGLTAMDLVDELVADGLLHVMRIPGGKRFLYPGSAWASLTLAEQERAPLDVARFEPGAQRALRRGEFVPGLTPREERPKGPMRYFTAKPGELPEGYERPVSSGADDERPVGPGDLGYYAPPERAAEPDAFGAPPPDDAA